MPDRRHATIRGRKVADHFAYSASSNALHEIPVYGVFLLIQLNFGDLYLFNKVCPLPNNNGL
jgi:hypothetical protein